MENKDIDKAAREYEIGDVVPYINTRQNIRLAKIESFGHNGLPNCEHWFNGIDILTGAKVWYSGRRSMALSEIARKYNPCKLKDEFNSRQSEIDELIEAVEEMRWIPVSERLPEVGKSGISKEVIADCPSVYKTLHYCKNSYYPNGAWFCASEELQSYPTHWRPIDTPKATQLLEKYGKK